MNQKKNTILKKISIYARACVRELSRAYFLLGLVRSTGLIAMLALLPLSSFSADKSAKKTTTEKPFRQAMQEASPAARLEAIKAYRAKRSGVTRDEFKAMRDGEKNGLVRMRLNQTMAETGLSDGGKLLIESLRSDADPMVRQGAAQSLGNFVQEPIVVTALAEALEKDSEAPVRYACALSLGLSKTPVAFAALEKAAVSTDPDLRRQVAFSLKRQDSKKADAILKKMRNDKDASVRMMAGATK